VFSRRKREPVAPEQDAVVDRVLCISVVTMLGAIADGLDEGAMDEGQAARYVTESHRWLIRENLVHALSRGERALIAKALPDWTPAESVGAGRRNESVGVLLWALSAIDGMPPYDARFERLPPVTPLLAPTAGFRASASLRSQEAIVRARGLAELWRWRARARQLQEREPQTAGHDHDAIARQAAALAYAEGAIAQPIDGDFPAYGKPYRALDADEYSAVSANAAERHHALSWLSGYASDWDSVPTST
jgi:hypothetical protein